MNLEQQLVYADKTYTILNSEQEFIIHPSALGMLPVGKASLQNDFSCKFHVEDYHLMLDQIIVSEQKNEQECEASFNNYKVVYNGALLIATDLVTEYYLKDGNLACFSYQKVFELIFEKGMLITTVDQSKAMLRIRKNLELGLRSLSKKRDLRCIKHFMNSAFVGDYKHFNMNYMRIRYLKEMQKEYETLTESGNN